MSADLKAELTKTDLKPEARCPVMGINRATHRHTAAGGKGNADWWPDQLNLSILHLHSPRPTRWASNSGTPSSSSLWRCRP